MQIIVTGQSKNRTVVVIVVVADVVDVQFEYVPLITVPLTPLVTVTLVLTPEIRAPLARVRNCAPNSNPVVGSTNVVKARHS